jgi:hypothetical protein
MLPVRQADARPPNAAADVMKFLFTIIDFLSWS